MTIIADVWFWTLAVVIPTIIIGVLLVWTIRLLRRIDKRLRR